MANRLLAFFSILWHFYTMAPWVTYYRQGLRRLAQREPHLALKAFQAAISACPVTQAFRLARILFYTGIALKKMGAHDRAVQTWAVSQKLIKNRRILKYMRLFSNDYCMAKQGFADLDDWRAFYAVQLNIYLKTKRSARLDSRAEADMIRDLIYDSWNTLKSSGYLEGMNCDEKMKIFRDIPIVFPLVSPSGDYNFEDDYPEEPQFLSSSRRSKTRYLRSF